jgi:hypothetical protein
MPCIPERAARRKSVLWTRKKHVRSRSAGGYLHSCPARARCREGIFAIRITPAGLLQPCMDRPDWTVPLVDWVRTDGETGAATRVQHFLEGAIA